MVLKKIKQIIVILNLQVKAVNNVLNKLDGIVRLTQKNHQETNKSSIVNLTAMMGKSSLVLKIMLAIVM